MNPQVISNLMNAIQKLEGFDKTLIDHTNALQTNKTALDAALPMIIAMYFQMMNMMTEIAALQMAVLTSLNPNQILKIANACEGQQTKNDQFTASFDAFLQKIGPLIESTE